MKNFDELLKKYADFIVRVGVNPQPGQVLIINCALEGAPLERLCVSLSLIHIWISPVRYLRRMQSSISSQKTPKYKKWAKKKNSLKSFDPKLFYDEVPMVGLEPTWFPERF